MNIQFKAQRVDTKEWVEGSLIIEKKNPEFKSIYSDINNSGKSDYLIYPINPSDGRAKEVLPETVICVQVEELIKEWEEDIKWYKSDEADFRDRLEQCIAELKEKFR